jgi:hypothetical protein
MVGLMRAREERCCRTRDFSRYLAESGMPLHVNEFKNLKISVSYVNVTDYVSEYGSYLGG